MAKKLFGKGRIRVDGKSWRTHAGGSLDMGGIKRNPRPGSNDADAYTEEVVPSKIETELQFGEGDSLAEIGAISDATITWELDTGQTYIIRGGYSSETPTLTEGEGKAKVVFMGPPAEEMV